MRQFLPHHHAIERRPHNLTFSEAKREFPVEMAVFVSGQCISAMHAFSRNRKIARAVPHPGIFVSRPMTVLTISSKPVARTPFRFLHRRSAITLGLATLALSTMSGTAPAHEAPSGWAYDMACCSDHDCRPEKSEVRATSRGWFITSTGETITYNDRRIHESKDGEFHRCLIQKGSQDPGITRCLYVPPMGL
jgi:hypothetical protein